jgi:hypothetical protein
VDAAQGLDFVVGVDRAGTPDPARLSKVGAGAGFATCSGVTNWISGVSLADREFDEGNQLTVCVRTDRGRLAALKLTVHYAGGTLSAVDVDVRTWY